MKGRLCGLLLATAAFAHAVPALADEAALQTEIDQLKAQLAAQGEMLRQMQAQLQAQAQAASYAAQPPQAQAVASAAPASLAEATVPARARSDEGAAADKPATTIGGYGEITYNGYLKDGSRNTADLRRFVLFFGHDFNDRLSFMSEVEIEHAISSADDHGEVEVEQAYLNYAFNPALNLKAGLFLMPFGLLNRNHEPPVFHGVMRNEVETRIIPTTWREGGIGLYGTTPFGLSYDVGVVTGFDVAKFDDAGEPLAASHQELQLARASDLSVYGSLEYRGIPGLLVGGSVFSGGALQDNADFRQDGDLPDFTGIKSRVTLWDVHARWQYRGFDLQGLYARGTISHADAIDNALIAYNMANGEERPLVPSAFYGWLVQGAYSFGLGGDMTLSPFLRYERFNTQARLPLGLSSDPENRDRVLTAGVSFHPLTEVVVKADYQKYFDNSGNDRINVGLGYMF